MGTLRTLAGLALAAGLLAGCQEGGSGPGQDPPLHTPRWAFEPWISKDISDTDDTYAFVRGFQERDIPFGVVVLDSPWETDYNTFEPNPIRYHDFEALLDDLHADGLRLVLWCTQMVNQSSFDLEPGGDSYAGPPEIFTTASRRGYLVNGGATYSWWKGWGGGLDFFHPRAVEFWHALQAPLLALGVDGFKLDFGESYIDTPTLETFQGPVAHQAYSEAYYRDFYAHGVRTRGPEEFLTMVRPYDRSYQFEGRFFARPEHAPVAWVGDQRRDWLGQIDALDHMFRSARAGYAVLGSDIGGYLDRDDQDMLETIPFRSEVFARWTALGALSPFMQLHGRANITPWTVPERQAEVVALYRFWSHLHHALVPFFYSLAEQAHAGGEPILRPQGDEADWPGDWRFMLGEALLVAPVLDDTGRRDVALPAGARWYDWWAPGAAPLEGGQTLPGVDTSALERIPLYVREGAILPLQDAVLATGLGSDAAAGCLSVLVWPGPAPTGFELHGEDDEPVQLQAQRAAGGSRVSLSQAPRSTYLGVRAEGAPAAVRLGGEALPALPDRAALDAAPQGWCYQAEARRLWVKLAAAAGERRVEIEAPRAPTP
ncbi:MAG TPA: glycoside hydrolase family 31 protein [Myxococcota bacterium]|nr:glycoside hydrolase family 31 protein [Myxococcota bacterium]HRY93188.1 glycoside hydrolase family 31 protein [Myxococcota bacterium]